MVPIILRQLKYEFSRPTPFLLLSILGVVFFTYVFFALVPDQTAGLGAMYALILIMVFSGAFLVDRVAVRKLKILQVVVAELAVIAIAWVFILWSYRSTTLLVKTEQDHFVVVFMEGGKTLDDFKSKGLFDKELIVSDNTCIVLAKSLQPSGIVQVKPYLWDGYSKTSENIFIKGQLRTVYIYRAGNANADTDTYLNCLETL